MPQITKAVSDDEEDNYDELQLRGGTSADEDTWSGLSCKALTRPKQFEAVERAFLRHSVICAS